jgi:FtsH-binding integral membrane protein
MNTPTLDIEEGKSTQYKNLDEFLPPPPSQTADSEIIRDNPMYPEHPEIQTVVAGIVMTGKEGFVFKVLNYIIAQLLITTIICSFAYGYKNQLYYYIYTNPGILALPMVGSFVSLCSLYYVKNKTTRLIIFIIFTLSISFIVAFTVIQYSSSVILKTVLITTCVVFSTNLYAYHCAKRNRDFSFMETGLLTGMIALIILGFLQIFIHDSFLHYCIVMLGVMLFTALLLYDLNRLYNETTSNDDPLMIAIAIYLDIINLFLYLLELIRCLTTGRD